MVTLVGTGVWSARTCPVDLRAAKELINMATIKTMLEIVLCDL
jgi:hypothetical protein